MSNSSCCAAEVLVLITPLRTVDRDGVRRGGGALCVRATPVLRARMPAIQTPRCRTSCSGGVRRGLRSRPRWRLARWAPRVLGDAPSVQPWTADDAGGVVFSAAELASATGGELVRSSSAGSVGTDTRSLRPGQWFLALSGASFDSDAFVGAALDAGCAGVISSKPIPPDWSAGYVRVDDALLALQSLASDVRRRFHGPVVAVTGSVGRPRPARSSRSRLRTRGGA